MNAWKEAEEAHNVKFIPDGNGTFTEGMGMLVGKDDLGFGKRSWRYSMLVKNGVVEKMFIEPNEPGDPFKVSDADTMLNTLHQITKCKNQSQSSLNLVAHIVRKQNSFYAIKV